MQSTFEDLANHAKLLSSRSSRQVWIAVAGAPGSGKTTLCGRVAQLLNGMGIKAAVIPMDGFHYYRRELDAMPDPALAHAKRGAHWTFNAELCVSTLADIRSKGSGIVPVSRTTVRMICGTNQDASARCN